MELWDRFAEAVADHFRFLEAEMGFTRTLMKRPNVIYESDKVQVQVYYDADGRYELDLKLRRILDDSRKALSLGVGTLMRQNGHAEGYLSPCPSTPENLETEVKHLAQLLREYGSAALSGDLRDFEEAERIERELAAKFWPPKQSR